MNLGVRSVYFNGKKNGTWTGGGCIKLSDSISVLPSTKYFQHCVGQFPQPGFDIKINCALNPKWVENSTTENTFKKLSRPCDFALSGWNWARIPTTIKQRHFKIFIHLHMYEHYSFYVFLNVFFFFLGCTQNLINILEYFKLICVILTERLLNILLLYNQRAFVLISDCFLRVGFGCLSRLLCS